MARWASAAVGLVVVVLSFSIQYVPGNLFELCYRVVNLFTVPLFILFFMAMFVPWATVFGTWAGTLASAAAAVVVSFWDLLVGSSAPSFLWIMPAAMLAGVVVGPLASLLPVGPPAAPPLPRAPAPE
jgi:Na+/proline symporter